jgi:rSAM/selenodomain-associated transferase 1
MTKGIIIFVKNPEIGKAKTRIAATVGDEKALFIYEALLSITKDVIKKVDVQKHLFYTHFVNSGDDWSNDVFSKYIQIDDDLGGKMKDAFERVLLINDKVIIIGSDCPKISKEIIQDAFDALNKKDVVIGPTFDGGYYLLGMKNLIPGLFDNMVFSTSSVFNDTLKRINDLSITHHILPTLHDVDYYEDWVAYEKSMN